MWASHIWNSSLFSNRDHVFYLFGKSKLWPPHVKDRDVWKQPRCAEHPQGFFLLFFFWGGVGVQQTRSDMKKRWQPHQHKFGCAATDHAPPRIMLQSAGNQIRISSERHTTMLCSTTNCAPLGIARKRCQQPNQNQFGTY